MPNTWTNGTKGLSAFASQIPEIAFNVKAFGAVGDDVTDDTAAIQAALTAGAGKTVVFPPGNYKVFSSLTILNGTKILGSGKLTTTLYSTGTNVDLFSVGTNINNFVFMDLTLSSHDGHLFNLAANVGMIIQSSWHRVHFWVQSDSKSAINMPSGEFLGNLLDDFEVTHSPSATVPTFNLISADGGMNTNTFNRGWCTYSGNYVFWVESKAATYAYDNTFSDINFEIPNGGCINLLSAMNTIIRGCNSYDLGTTTKDLYNLNRSNVAYPFTRHTLFESVNRRGGTLGGGLVDIRSSSNARHVTLINCSHSSANITVDAAGQETVAINSPSITWLNDAEVTTLPIALWKSYTPVISGTGASLGSGTIIGSYARIGNTIHYKVSYIFGSGSSMATSGATRFSLPLANSTSGPIQVSAEAVDAGNNFYTLNAVSQGTTNIELYTVGTGGAYGSGVSTAAPFTWVSGDSLTLAGTYEV